MLTAGWESTVAGGFQPTPKKRDWLDRAKVPALGSARVPLLEAARMEWALHDLSVIPLLYACVKLCRNTLPLHHIGKIRRFHDAPLISLGNRITADRLHGVANWRRDFVRRAGR